MMNISISTFIISVGMNILLVLFLCFFLRSKIAYSLTNAKILIVLSWLIILRLFLPVEIPSFTVTIPSEKIFPLLYSVLEFQLWRDVFSVKHLLVAVWGIGTVAYLILLFRLYNDMHQIKKLPNGNDSSINKMIAQLSDKQNIKKNIPYIRNSHVTIEPNKFGLVIG